MGSDNPRLFLLGGAMGLSAAILGLGLFLSWVDPMLGLRDGWIFMLVLTVSIWIPFSALYMGDEEPSWGEEQ